MIDDSALPQDSYYSWLKFVRIDGYVEEFKSESDRGCAILAICVLEDFLSAALHWRLGGMADDYIKELAPKGRVNVTIRSSGLLNIMSPDEMADARRLVHIRNEFAHKLAQKLTFDAPSIKNELRQLRVLDRTMPSWPPANRSGRDRYLLSLMTLHLHVSRRFVLMPRMAHAAEQVNSERPHPGKTVEKGDERM